MSEKREHVNHTRFRDLGVARWRQELEPVVFPLALGLLLAGCGEWVTQGPGPRVPVETDPPGAAVSRNGESLGKAPLVDDLSTIYERREYQRSPACYPVAGVLSAGLVVTGLSLLVYGLEMPKTLEFGVLSKRTDTATGLMAGGTAGVLAGLLVGTFALKGCAQRPADHSIKLFKREDVDSVTSAEFTYSAELPGHKKSETLTVLPDQKEPIRLFLAPDSDSRDTRPQEAHAAPAASARPTAAPAPAPPKPPATAVSSFRSGASRSDAFALVVGIERYRDLPAPVGARGDAENFARMAGTTLGIPERNIRMLRDDRATKNDIAREIAWLRANVPAGGRIIFYFSGHGTPELNSGDSLLLPFDASPETPAETGLPLPTLLADLAHSQAGDIVAIVDSCFSGSGRSVMPPGVRPLVPVKTIASPARVALFSATAAGETSDNREGNLPGGLFTQFVLEGLGQAQADIDGDGAITLKELADWVGPRVAREARRQGRAQNPTLTVGADLGQSQELIMARGLGER